MKIKFLRVRYIVDGVERIVPRQNVKNFVEHKWKKTVFKVLRESANGKSKMYYPARILNVAESKADLVKPKATSGRTRLLPLKYLDDQSNESDSYSSENETSFCQPEKQNVAATEEESFQDKMKKVEDMLQKKAIATQLQPVIELHRIESQAQKIGQKENMYPNDLTPTSKNNDNILRELEFLRKENEFLREECKKKDQLLEEKLGRLQEAISHMEAVTTKASADTSSPLIQQASYHDEFNGPITNGCSPNGQATLMNGVTVSQNNLRNIRTMSKTPSIFVGDLAELVFDKKTLISNTIFGKKKGKGKLCSQKMEAIHCEFEKWLRQDMAYNTQEVYQQLRKMHFYINKKCGWLQAEKRRHEKKENGSSSNLNSGVCNSSDASIASSSSASTSCASKPRILNLHTIKRKIIISQKSQPNYQSTSQSQLHKNVSETNSKSIFQPWAV